ncbi:MAG: hypothetical protein BWX86_02787 [Verrucomicrobia bacterium ADurb.Bin122]|nr:MAG: hypothetical protein BWX86_02787 [Verrucomicrobia bacterium ADurb.Bin122]
MTVVPRRAASQITRSSPVSRSQRMSPMVFFVPGSTMARASASTAGSAVQRSRTPVSSHQG